VAQFKSHAAFYTYDHFTLFQKKEEVMWGATSSNEQTNRMAAFDDSRAWWNPMDPDTVDRISSDGDQGERSGVREAEVAMRKRQA